VAHESIWRTTPSGGIVKRLERPEKVVQPHSLPRTAPQADQQNRPLDINDGPTLARSPSPASNVSPWLFVMATALNTMVASVLAVIITLGVVTQERSDSLPREAALASYARPAVGMRSADHHAEGGLPTD
jgi:hypothetical protein